MSDRNTTLQCSSISLTPKTLLEDFKLEHRCVSITAWPPTCSSPSQASSIKQVTLTWSTLTSSRDARGLLFISSLWFCLREAVAGQRERAELGVPGGAAGQSVSQEEEGVWPLTSRLLLCDSLPLTGCVSISPRIA